MEKNKTFFPGHRGIEQKHTVPRREDGRETAGRDLASAVGTRRQGSSSRPPLPGVGSQGQAPLCRPEGRWLGKGEDKDPVQEGGIPGAQGPAVRLVCWSS